MQFQKIHLKLPAMLTLLLTALLFVSCTPPQESSEGEISAETQALVDKFIEMWNTGNGDLAAEIVTDDFVRKDPNASIKGVAGLKEAVEGVKPSFPDFTVKVKDSARKGDVLYIHWTMKGTNNGPLTMGEASVPATGKSFTSEGMSKIKLSNGKFREELVIWDQLTAYQQLGFQIVPPQAEEVADTES